ncbi:MAG: hypothetical protein ACJA14_002314, partial [Ilumatobacter sp.]
MLSENSMAPAGIVLVQSVLGCWASTVMVLAGPGRAGPSGSAFGPTVSARRLIRSPLHNRGSRFFEYLGALSCV